MLQMTVHVDLTQKEHGWPKECLDLAGRFADFPLLDFAQCSGASFDVLRMGFYASLLNWHEAD